MTRLSARTLLAVTLGGILGGSLRLLLMGALPWDQAPIADHLALTQEFLTLTLINLAGSFALGCVAGLASRSVWPDWLRVGMSTGVLGSFTTLSAVTTAWLAATATLSADPSTSSASLAIAGTLGVFVLLLTTLLGALLAAAGLHLTSHGSRGS